MKRHELLGQLSHLQQMMAHLFGSIPEEEAYRSFAPGVPSLAWLFGRGVYAETYWVREVLQADADMTGRVAPLFCTGVEPDERAGQLPPRDHLLNWALELQDENLMRLANPALLPEHPLLRDDRLLHLVIQEYARLYELALAQLTARQVALAPGFEVQAPLRAQAPSTDHADVHRGHYRVGSKGGASALDNELPTQVVELDAFRIDTRPVSNGAWLGFMEAGGYETDALWSEEGAQWRRGAAPHPFHWRQDPNGNWYGIGLNGPFELLAGEPVSGISRFEAEAYAHWVATLGERLAGAVLQHEYQWEVATRSRAIAETGRVWEWCANPFHPYSGYEAPEFAEAATPDFDAGRYTLRGASLHTQPVIRRATYRNRATPEQRALFSGTRLVFPASDMPWHGGGH